MTILDICKLEAVHNFEAASCLQALSKPCLLFEMPSHTYCMSKLCPFASISQLPWRFSGLLHDSVLSFCLAVCGPYCQTLYADSANGRVGKNFLSSQGPDLHFQKRKPGRWITNGLFRGTGQRTSQGDFFWTQEFSAPYSSELHLVSTRERCLAVFPEVMGWAPVYWILKTSCCFFKRGNK